MSALKTTKVHFTVDGEGMTELARNSLLSEDPHRAWRIMSALIGDGREDIGKAVLDGTMKLVNAPDDDTLLMAVKDDGAERYLRDLRYIYAGRIRMDGTWWRPVAVVEKYGPESAAWASSGLEGKKSRDGIRVVRAWADRRAEFFCGKLERATLVGEMPRRQYVIWEVCGEVPHWWPLNRNPKEALADSEKAKRRLEKRGEHIRSHDIAMELEGRPGISNEEAKEIRNEQTDADAMIHDVEYEAALAKIGDKVREQAGDDTFVLVVEADDRSEDRREVEAAFAGGAPKEPKPAREIVVPRAPFVRWALHRTSLWHLAPPWEAVSPVGMKLQLDEPCHTDWMLGAGLDLREDYGFDKPVSKAATKEMFRLQEEMGGFEAAVLVDHGPFYGRVGEDIVVLPNLGPAHADAVMGAKAIITERGGQLAHLAVIAMETGITVMLVPDAITRYPEGTSLTLEPETGTIRTSPLPRS